MERSEYNQTSAGRGRENKAVVKRTGINCLDVSAVGLNYFNFFFPLVNVDYVVVSQPAGGLRLIGRQI